MNIRIVCVGSIKESFYVDAVAEYVKRISRYHKIEIIEVKEGNKNKSIDEIKNIECTEILRHIKGYIVALDKSGKMLDSVAFSKVLEKVAGESSSITFCIGGSHGLNQEILSKADLVLSFSYMTFPHQLFRVMLAEQLYRATTITNNIMYHK